MSNLDDLLLFDQPEWKGWIFFFNIWECFQTIIQIIETYKYSLSLVTKKHFGRWGSIRYLFSTPRSSVKKSKNLMTCLATVVGKNLKIDPKWWLNLWRCFPMAESAKETPYINKSKKWTIQTYSEGSPKFEGTPKLGFSGQSGQVLILHFCPSLLFEVWLMLLQVAPSKKKTCCWLIGRFL